MQFLRALTLGPMSLRPHARSKGGGAPAGFVFLTDADGAILKDDDGAYLMEAA